MIYRFKNFLNQAALETGYKELSCIEKEILANRLMLGKVLENQNFEKVNLIIEDIQKSEFKVFSQWGDDGIINFLVNYLDIKEKKFVEFGVENYNECNTRFLLENNNWEGFVIDGSKGNIDYIKQSNLYWRYCLKAIDTFVTAENINELLFSNGFLGEVGLLHIDIDGNDYWVWKSISVINPIIVIVEYNSVFGAKHNWTIPYDPGFQRTNAHFSNLYFGVSIRSLCQLAEEKGYSFIGCNSNGNNAYFVRNDKLKDIKVKTPEEGYVLSHFSESRDVQGNLTFIRGLDRLEVIKGMPIFDTSTGKMETIT